MKIIKNIMPDIGERKVERFLVQRNGRGKAVSRRTKKALYHAIDDCKRLIKPSVLYTEKPIRKAGNGTVILEDGVSFDGARLSGAMRKCESTTVFLVTVGNEVDRKINDLMRNKRFSKAYIYDAIGSVAAEETADMFQNMFDSGVKEEGKTTTLRFSPGYCDWPLEQQRKLFQVIDSSAIGVELRQSCLMRPRKSISGIFGVGSVLDIEKKKSNPCVSCSHKTCFVRRSA